MSAVQIMEGGDVVENDCRGQGAFSEEVLWNQVSVTGAGPVTSVQSI